MDLKVFITTHDTACSECGADLGRHAWILLAGERGALCLACADLDHLLFLAPGDAALTRRAHQHSTLSAVVLQWSRARKRYERQGLLVEAQALEKAEEECLADWDARQRRHSRGDRSGAGPLESASLTPPGLQICMSKPPKRLGKLPPQYIFFLNPYDDLRFSRCPQCNGKTQQRKLPLVIWVDPQNPVVLNYTTLSFPGGMPISYTGKDLLNVSCP